MYVGGTLSHNLNVLRMSQSRPFTRHLVETIPTCLLQMRKHQWKQTFQVVAILCDSINVIRLLPLILYY